MPASFSSVLTTSTSRNGLATATAHEGQRLARELAGDLIASVPAPVKTAAELLRSGAGSQLDLVTVTAIYFHAISLANNGWRD